MKKEKAIQIAENVLKQIGGKDNVSKVLHCQTRLRFNLKDESIADDAKIEAITGVLGVVRAGGQLQVVVGTEVKDVYREICEIGNFENTDKDIVPVKKEKITIKSIGNGILDAISGSMGPAIPAIVASAFFKMLVAVLGPDVLDVLHEGNDLYTLFTFVGDAAFYFFPVIVGYTSAKKFNLNPVLGILMGAILIHPTFVGLVGKEFTVYGIPCNVQSYASSIVPIILSNWVMSYIAHFFDRIIPGSIRSVFSPAFTLAAMLPIALCVFGPAGVFIGEYVVAALFSLEGIAGFIGIGLIAALYPVLVMTGMHMVLITTLFQIFATKGFDGFAAVAVSVSSFSIMGVGIGAFLRLKNKEQKALALSYGITAIVAGTSEPTIYGICTKYKKPFIGLLAGGFLGGAYAGLTGVIDATLVPSSNIFAALCFLGKSQANVVNGIIACVIAFVATAVFVYFFGFDKNEKDIQG
ncbi:PTS transporter subunit EIIC [Amedibacillus dolichus]|uniref:PTS transporter subunit EIIC n=1 Tax=Amedibacillus dolichus TaxID=31971 RepID=UPI002E760738|nr:PTS transporter subunit EIIC [Amedibacillus dolichus]MEE0383641.1 PTS transporter subunit EIIC [Amedibacillus dolichus]